MQKIEENCCFSNWNIVNEFRMGIILHSSFKYTITCIALNAYDLKVRDRFLLSLQSRQRKKVCVMLWPVYFFIPSLQLQIAQVLMGEYVLS